MSAMLSYSPLTQEQIWRVWPFLYPDKTLRIFRSYVPQFDNIEAVELWHALSITRVAQNPRPAGRVIISAVSSMTNDVWYTLSSSPMK